jgi:hypothetical protein
MPTLAYCKDGPGCPEHTIRADFPVTPEMVEILEISEAHGSDTAALRGNQLASNRQRRQLRADRKRFAQMALQHNLRIAAERMVAEKLAAPKAGVEAPPIAEPVGKKPPAAAVTGTEIAAEEAENIA